MLATVSNRQYGVHVGIGTRNQLGAALAVLAFAACDTGPIVLIDAGHDAAAADAASLDVACQPMAVADDPHAAERTACAFAAGAHVADTLGFDAAARARMPITHVIIVTQENRSFDHMFGHLSRAGQPEAEGIPDAWRIPDSTGTPVAPTHATTTCLPTDPPHQWDAMHAAWDMGAMDGFVRVAAIGGSDGLYVLTYNDSSDLPFYHWLASTFAIGDRYFGSSLGGTWANRDYLYAATSNGVRNTGEATLAGVRSVFDQLDDAQVRWGVYTTGIPRQDCLGWTVGHRGVHSIDVFLALLADGTLPPVSFVDPSGASDEHPPGNLQGGESWEHQIYDTAIASPLWPHLALFLTYDESGGFFDHVPPPAACIPSADQADFDRYGIRIPMTVVSPWARAHSVSHRTHDHTSLLRFVQLIHDLPALTARDANADALLDLFDFGCPTLLSPPAAPAAGTGGCR